MFRSFSDVSTFIAGEFVFFGTFPVLLLLSLRAGLFFVSAFSPPVVLPVSFQNHPQSLTNTPLAFSLIFSLVIPLVLSPAFSPARAIFL